MGHDTVIFIVVPSDEEHIRMLELEKEWIEKQRSNIPRDHKVMSDELGMYYSMQGCYNDYSRLNPNGKRIELCGARAYDDQSILLSELPKDVIGIDILQSY